MNPVGKISDAYSSLASTQSGVQGQKHTQDTNALQNNSDKATLNKSDKTKSNFKNYGQTIGEPKLSKEAAKYYEQLKKKYGQYDFILVSEDKKDYAQANISKFTNPNKMVVLIDEDKIEKMATDEKYRKKIENVISGADKQIEQLKASLNKSGVEADGFGMKVNDNGTASFFATLKQSSDAQAARIEQKAEAKKAEKKAAEKKAAKEDAAERLENSRAEKKEKAKEFADKLNGTDSEDDTITFSANSVDELLKKIEDYSFSKRADQVMTPEEQVLGQTIDFKG